MSDSAGKYLQFFILPGFNLMSFTAGIEALRVANRLTDKDLYHWSVVGEEQSLITASNGIPIMPNYAIDISPKPDYFFVCASFHAKKYITETLTRHLNTLANEGTGVGAIGTGTYILAQAGLLDGFKCTIHWEDRPTLIELFPNLVVTRNVYEIDGNRFTCSGGGGALDMMVQLIAKEHGNELAIDILNQLIHDRMRTPGDQQKMSDEIRAAAVSPKLANAIKIMQDNIESPLPIPEISSRVAVAQSQLERYFKSHCGHTPQEHYVWLRLQHGRALLMQTGLPILDVAVASGFSSQGYFTRRYQRVFGITPLEERKNIRMAIRRNF